jgi:hypothetical protein
MTTRYRRALNVQEGQDVMNSTTTRGRRGALSAALGLAAMAACGLATTAQAQAVPSIIGPYDNFDAFNDTGQTAEGFEIDVEDVSPADVTREFPSNFAQPWLIRYGLPTVTAYDWTSATPDAAHAYDAGHKGVLVTWAATLQNGAWVASQGNAVAQGAPGAAGNGTPYNPKPTATAGESCWWWGLGATYPDAGCDHFGISFAGGVVPGKITYHWKLPDPTNSVLINGPLEATIPPSPVLIVAPPVVNAPPAPPVVVAVARAPADAGRDPNRPQELEPQYGDAYWLKTTTLYGNAAAALDGLQIHLIKNIKTKKTVKWTLLQKPPGVGPKAGAPEREAAENDGFANNKVVQVTKQYQYYKFSGAYDSETHEALCEQFYATAAAALAGGTVVQLACQNANGDDLPYQKKYYTIDPGPGTVLTALKGNLGDYIGAHVNAYNVK